MAGRVGKSFLLNLCARVRILVTEKSKIFLKIFFAKNRFFLTFLHYFEMVAKTQKTNKKVKM
jgi:hypothetical protein